MPVLRSLFLEALGNPYRDRATGKYTTGGSGGLVKLRVEGTSETSFTRQDISGTEFYVSSEAPEKFATEVRDALKSLPKQDVAMVSSVKLANECLEKGTAGIARTRPVSGRMDVQLYASNCGAPSYARKVLAHEVGHAAEVRILGSAASYRESRLSQEFAALAKTHGRVSQYGKVSLSENFAEMYMQWHTSHRVSAKTSEGRAAYKSWCEKHLS